MKRSTKCGLVLLTMLMANSIGVAFSEKYIMANKRASSTEMKVNNIAGSNAAVADAASGG